MPDAIGDTMYLFRMPGNPDCDTLVISAHGGIKSKNSPTFQVPEGTTLQYYSEHGVVTDDLGIRNFATGGKQNQRTDAISGPARSYNYDLSKYQGKHNKAGETYESIESAQDYVTQFREIAQAARSQGVAVPYSPTDFDVLTIRNRWWISGMTLSAALTAVAKTKTYSIVHCYFCRSFY